MLLLRSLVILALVVAAIGAMPALGQSVDIPLTNWTVPVYHRSSSGGLTTMTDISPGVAFVAIQPCRVVDTRGGGVFTGAYGPPIMAANAIRPFDINSAPHCTGIPAGSDAYSLNFTVTETVGPGDIRAWPTGNPPEQVTSVLNFTAANVTIANATIVPAGTGGSIDVQVAGSNTQLLIDINGYFTDTYNTGVQFVATGLVNGNGVIIGTNTSATSGSSGVKGVAGGGATVFGVLGQTTSVSGVSVGVKGISTTEAALSGALVPSTAGVMGSSSAGDGVRGVTQNLSGGSGVIGIRTASTGSIQTSGELGFSSAVAGYFEGDVTITGDLDVLGAGKNFVEPHPTDASKAIRYTALEGGESGTYFRGRARFQNGIARISAPEDFRLTTAPEGLTVQVTPIGEMATYAVVRMDLDEIVVRGSRNVEFFYMVNGVRRTSQDLHPIVDAGTRFVPRAEGSRLSNHLPEESRRRLIANGTYNPDGTVNMETARRLGWDRIWAEREHETPAPQPNP